MVVISVVALESIETLSRRTFVYCSDKKKRERMMKKRESVSLQLKEAI
jgi:hypothetical protein